MSDTPEGPNGPAGTYAYNEDGSSNLAMSFVTVKSVGGPHDDDSFSAGYQAGMIDAMLSTRRLFGTTVQTIFASVYPQVDLIAMQYGYTCDIVAENRGFAQNWLTVSFTRIDDWGKNVEPNTESI